MTGKAAMTSGRWERIKTIFSHAAELPPNERAAYFALECGGDIQLRAEVESLLAALEAPGSFLGRAAVSGLTRTVRPSWLSAAAGAEGRFLPGEVFAERFRIIGLAGRGGMGEVYRAYDLKLNQTIALKFLPSAGREALERFRNEVRTARQVTHANVCRVFDIGETEESAYLTMEYIDGEDLASLLLRIGRLSEDKASEIALQICAGLQAAHEKGILHRDLKPGNVMLDGRGQARITDFGLAALADTIEGREAGHGTPLYMAPEQLAGREATVRSDIYALGLILFEMFTGMRPFEGGDADELLRLRAAAPTPQPSATVSTLPPRIERAILRCLDPNPSARPASAGAVAGALAGKDTATSSSAGGRTPASDSLEASGPAASLRPGVALALLLFTALGMPLVALWGNRIGWMSRFDPRMSPEILAHEAQQLAVSFGYGAPVDSTWDFVAPQTARSLTIRTVEFWYRQAPCAFQPDRLEPGVMTVPPGRVTPANPREACPGDLNLYFDVQGRLAGLRGAPVAGFRSAAPDWSRPLAAAGLDQAKLRSAPPETPRGVIFDSEQAWLSDSGVRIQAASWRGAPVYFSVGQDTLASTPAALPGRYSKPSTAPPWVGLAVFAVLAAGALLLVRHNLRHHRGDRRGAFHIARFVFCLNLLVWIFYATHRATAMQGTLVAYAVGWALMLGGAAGLFYMALDPYVRRRWPRMLATLQAILDGNGAGPLAARDVLLGMAAGVVLGALYFSRFQVDRWYGGAPALAPLPGWLGGLGAMLSGALFCASNAVWMALSGIALLFFFRLILRRTWLAGLAFVGLFAVSYVPASAHPWADLPIEVLMATTIFVVLIRAGLVSSLVSGCVGGILYAAPISFDLSRWYAAPSLGLFAGLAAIAFIAYRRALPARGVLRDDMLYR